jgi:hypothetical protein
MSQPLENQPLENQPLENQPLEKVEPKVVGGRNPPEEPKVVGGRNPPVEPKVVGGRNPPVEPKVVGGRNPPVESKVVGGRNPQIKIISGHSVFNENAVVLSQKFKWALETNFDPQPNDLYIVYGAHELAHQLLEVQFRKNNSFGYIIMNSEQTESQFFKNKYYLSLMKRNIVFDYNTLTTDYLKEKHDIKVLSYFFFEFMKFHVEEENRSYDVAFIGSKNERREDFINLIKKQYPDLNVYVDFEWKHSNAESLTKILQQCKVVLNIPYYKHNPLETHRINKALSCGCDVISLNSADDDANTFYKDYCVMTDDLIGAVGDYFIRGDPLKNPDNKPENDKRVVKGKSLKSYEELVKTLSQKFNPHMCFIVDHVHKKLLSISNGDKDEVVHEQTPADDNVSTDEATEVALGDKV